MTLVKIKSFPIIVYFFNSTKNCNLYFRRWPAVAVLVWGEPSELQYIVRSLILLSIPSRRQFFVRVFQNFHGTFIINFNRTYYILIQSDKYFTFGIYIHWPFYEQVPYLKQYAYISDFHCDLKWWPIMTILVSFLFKSSSKLEPELLCCRLKDILLFQKF